jgi:hypothetical protein
MKRLIILLLIFTLISGCIDKGQDTTIYRGETIPEYSPVVDMAKKDLAEKLNTQVENIHLVKQEAVEWPDSSLGNPEEGIMYSQVVTPGFRIILTAGNKSYEYHSDYHRVVALRITNNQPVSVQTEGVSEI